MRKVFLLIFLLLASSLTAEREEAAKAARYFEAKQYEKALDTYEGLLKQTLTPWERSVVQYNIGCAQLADGHPAAAIAEWSAIPLGVDPFPLLSRRIHTNIAVAKLQQIEKIDLTSSFAFEKATFLLQQARAYIQRAESEECALQKLEGAISCTPAADLEKIKSLIDEKFTKGVIQWQSFEQAHSKPTMGLEHLLNSYKLALIEEPLQETTLTALLEEQKNAQFDVKELELALKALQQGDPLSARFFFQKARFQLTKIVQHVKRETIATPLQILETAIEEQHEALVLNRLADRMESGEKKGPAIIEGIMTPQENAVKEAALFKPGVYQIQVQGFKKECQADPWSEVLPLFDEGERLAFEASHEASNEHPLPSLDLQELALQKWSQALELLKQPKKASKSSCKGSAGQSGAQKENAPAEQKQAVPMNQVLQNIQKMEQEDQTKQVQQAPKEVERPW